MSHHHTLLPPQCVSTAPQPLGQRPAILYGVDEPFCVGPAMMWANNPQNFDNFLQGFLVLFQLATLEMWPSVMYDFVDARGPGE